MKTPEDWLQRFAGVGAPIRSATVFLTQEKIAAIQLDAKRATYAECAAIAVGVKFCDEDRQHDNKHPDAQGKAGDYYNLACDHAQKAILETLENLKLP